MFEQVLISAANEYDVEAWDCAVQDYNRLTPMGDKWKLKVLQDARAALASDDALR